MGVVVISLLIELLTCVIYYKGKKNGILYDKNLKQIGIFNMVSVSLIPILIGIISSPIDKKKAIKCIPDIENYEYVPVNNSMLAKAEIPFLIFERNRGKCFIEMY